MSRTRHNGSGGKPTVIDARKALVYVLHNQGEGWTAISKIFTRHGLNVGHATIMNAYYRAADLYLLNESFKSKVTQIERLMCIACIPNARFMLTERCDGCMNIAECDDKVYFTDTAEVRRHVKESLVACLAACHLAGIDIDEVEDSITDDELKAIEQLMKGGRS